MKSLKNQAIAALLAILVCLLTSRAGAADAPGKTNPAAPKTKSKTSDLFGDTVVAKGKGFEIKRSQLDDEVIRLKALAAARNQPISSDQSAILEKQVLEQLIQIQLLQGKASAADKAAGKE